MTPEGIRFQYPAEILVETTRKVVPEDTTLVSKMDPVTKEDLPLYDAMPMPRPLSQRWLAGTSIELGAGAPYLPRVDLRSLIISNDQSALELNGKFKTTTAVEPAIKQFWQLGVSGNFLFPSGSVPVSEQIPELDIDAATGANKRLLVSEIDSSPHTLSKTDLDAAFIIGSPSQLKLRLYGAVTLLNDDTGPGTSENSAKTGLSLIKDIPNSSYRTEFDLSYVSASSIGLLSYNPHYIETQLFFQQKENELLRWRAGISYLGGSDAIGSTSIFFPVIEISSRLSHSVEIGAGFEPKPQLTGLKELLSSNLFYSPAIQLASGSTTDPRRVVSEPIHLNLFANYFLLLDDELHVELRYITRNNEPTFFSDTDTKGHVLFVATPINTRRTELEAGGSLLLFTKDKLRVSLLFRSASDMQTGFVLPFEPTAQIQAAYEFGNISEKFTPVIEFIHLRRIAGSFTFINVEARYIFSQKFQLHFRAENILGNAGDFWTGYDEYPRSVWVSAQYLF